MKLKNSFVWMKVFYNILKIRYNFFEVRMNRKKAFALAELIFALAVFIISLVLLVFISSKINKNFERKIKFSSEIFYSKLSVSYQGFIISKTKNNDAKKIIKNEENLPIAKYIANHFVKDLKGKEIDCADFFKIISKDKLDKISTEIKPDNLYCFELSSKIIASVFYKDDCSLKLSTKAYFNDENLNEKKELCGYLTYSYKDIDKSEIDKYIYSIGLGRYFAK